MRNKRKLKILTLLLMTLLLSLSLLAGCGGATEAEDLSLIHI